MAYFDNAKAGDKVFGLIFGKGKIVEVFDEHYYSLIVRFKNGYEVPFNKEGVAGWGNFNKQTLFYLKDIQLDKLDFSPLLEVLKPKEIQKLRNKNKLEIRVPSGLWVDVKKADQSYVEAMLEKKRYHLFRKKKKKTKKKK